MEPSQPSYNTFEPSSSADCYPSASSQPYMVPSDAAYCYDPVVTTYPSPAVVVYPVDGGYPTPSYHTETTYPVHSGPTQRYSPQPSAAPYCYPSSSSQPYMTPSDAAYSYGPVGSSYPCPGPAVYPVDRGYPTPSYQVGPSYPTYSRPS